MVIYAFAFCYFRASLNFYSLATNLILTLVPSLCHAPPEPRKASLDVSYNMMKEFLPIHGMYTYFWQLMEKTFTFRVLGYLINPPWPYKCIMVAHVTYKFMMSCEISILVFFGITIKTCRPIIAYCFDSIRKLLWKELYLCLKFTYFIMILK